MLLDRAASWPALQRPTSNRLPHRAQGGAVQDRNADSRWDPPLSDSHRSLSRWRERAVEGCACERTGRTASRSPSRPPFLRACSSCCCIASGSPARSRGAACPNGQRWIGAWSPTASWASRSPAARSPGIPTYVTGADGPSHRFRESVLG